MKTILITGANSDIGFSIAKRRAALGDRIRVTCSSQKSLEECLKRLSEHQISAQGIVFDLATPEASLTSLEALLKDGVDSLVLNAAGRVTKLRPFHQLSERQFNTYVSNNLFGNAWLLRQLLPGMMERGYGRLVFVSSVAVVTGHARYPAYCTSKSAIEGLFLNLAVDYGAFNILSNVVRPGIIATSRTERFWRQPAYFKKSTASIPQGCLGSSDQVAETLDPLLSETSYMNGSVLTVSGGLPLIPISGYSGDPS